MKVAEAVICLDCDEVFSMQVPECPKCGNSKTFKIKTVLPSLLSIGFTDTVVLKDIVIKKGRRRHVKQTVPDEHRLETIEATTASALQDPVA